MIAAAQNNEDGTVTVKAFLKVEDNVREYTCIASTFEEAKAGLLVQIEGVIVEQALRVLHAKHGKPQP